MSAAPHPKLIELGLVREEVIPGCSKRSCVFHPTTTRYTYNDERIMELVDAADTLQLIVNEQGECPQMGHCIAGQGTDTPHKDLADATLKTNRRLVRELEKANELLDCIEANASGSNEPESWPVWVAEHRYLRPSPPQEGEGE